VLAYPARIEPGSDSGDRWIGTRIGEYQVKGLLGVGGMGKVYRATGPDGTRVALKLVRREFARNPTFRRRFSREARIAQTVKHPNVVPVLSTGEHDELPYMAQRFIEGRTLDQALKQEGKLDVASVVRVGSDVAAGLEALWAAGMVHRDVKPANILIDERGRAYITDFGLAKDTRGSLLTASGQTLGSMDYMAPEQIRGEPVSAATDTYALGCVLYEALCGQPPFADIDGVRILSAHLQEEPPDPLTLRDDLTAEVGRALLRALEKDANDRPASAGEYVRMLAEAAGVSLLSENRAS
jgi:serine/threonine-protein kinase